MKSKSASILISIIVSLSLNAQVGIGTNSPDGSAILHLSTTTKGFLPPVMTTTNRGNIGTPVDGLLLFNTTDGKLNFYKSGWYSIPLCESGAPGINLGIGAGKTSQHATGIAIGNDAGVASQGEHSISLGNYAGYMSQAAWSVAVGKNAGMVNQGSGAISIGLEAGYNTQGSGAVAIGNFAAIYSQGSNSIGIGTHAGTQLQGLNSIAFGNNAGMLNQGNQAIAIGSNAGKTNQSANSIILNATGNELNSTASGFFVDPIRSSAGGSPSLIYNTVTKELQHTASDARLKNNIQSLTFGLDEVMRLQPVSFNFRESLESSNYDGHNIGFIAQQVKEVIPEAVTENPDSLLAINTTTLIPVLVKAIQELKEENQILSAKIEQLQQKINTKKLFFKKRK